MNERVPHHRVVSGVLRDAQTPAIRPLPHVQTAKCVLGYVSACLLSKPPRDATMYMKSVSPGRAKVLRARARWSLRA